MQVLLRAILLLAVVTACLSQNVQSLLDTYTISWTIQDDEITLTLNVQTTGWIGFGLGEPSSGSMQGSDIVVGFVNTTGAYISDRWAAAKGVEPAEDNCQSWALVSGQEMNGNTTLTMKRKLVTNDTQDRDIAPGPLAVVIAWGDNGNDALSYHSTNRLSTSVEFIAVPPYNWKTPDVQYFDIVMQNYTTNITTDYACISYALPINETADYHIVGMEAIIEEKNKKHVHHFGLISCSAGNDTWFQDHLTGKGCYSGGRSAYCTYTVWGWAQGTTGFATPKEAGFRMGNNSWKYAMVQIHYDNPTAETVVDNSGIRIYYTPNLRPYDAGALTLGDGHVSSPTLAPGQKSIAYEYECPSECTSSWPHNITIFSFWSHMHITGSMMFATLNNGSQFDNYLARTEYYDFAHQKTVPLVPALVVEPGQRINTHCVWDTTTRVNNTNFGPASTDEMCVGIAYYYPEIPNMPNCDYKGNKVSLTQNDTICGYTAMGLLNPRTFDSAERLNKAFGASFNGQCVVPVITTTTTTGAASTSASTTTGAASSTTTGSAASTTTSSTAAVTTGASTTGSTKMSEASLLKLTSFGLVCLVFLIL